MMKPRNPPKALHRWQDKIFRTFLAACLAGAIAASVPAQEAGAHEPESSTAEQNAVDELLGPAKKLPAWLGFLEEPFRSVFYRIQLFRCDAAPVSAADGNSPVLNAVRQGNDGELQRLIAAGANVNEADSRRQTALWHAAHSGNSRAVQILVNAGAELNARNETCVSPMEAAAAANHWEIVQTLLGAGAQVDWAEGGGAVLRHAAAKAPIETLKLMIIPGKNSNLNVNVKMNVNVNVNTNLNVNVNARSMTGETALMKASESGRLDAVWLLIGAGSEVNARRNDGASALDLAVEKNQWAVVHTLLENGADEKSGGYTLLQRAAGKIPMDIAMDLIRRGADVNSRGPEGFTPLIVAAGSGNYGVAEVLLRAGPM